MGALLRLIRAAERGDWDRWIEPVAHDFYHTAAYHAFSEAAGEGEAFLAVYGSEDRYLAWPYLLRPVEQAPALRDVASVYGYAGPLLHGAADPLFLERAHQCLRSLWRAQGAVTAFTRFHPLLENHRLVLSAGVTDNGETVSIDLTQARPDAFPDYRAGLRKDIRRGRRLGLATTVEEDWSALAEFVRLYHATMRRNRAASQYFFPADYFRRLKQALGAHAFLAVTRLGGSVAAAGVVIEYRRMVHNHFLATADESLWCGPSKVLLDDVRGWGAARGDHVFHLGGGRGAQRDSLFRFKARFSPRRHGFYTGRWVLERRLYEELSAGYPDTGYFPAYRAPACPARPVGA